MNNFSVSKRGVMLIFAGLLLMVIGYILMAGGGSADPNIFNEGMFNFRRITLAPIVIIAGIVLVIVAIMRPSKQKEEEK